jgi:glycosyltransferase involved in cell wall biosynthesis
LKGQWVCETVVIVNDTCYVTGGAGKVALSSAIGLTKRGLRVIVFSAVGNEEQMLEREGVEVICLYQRDILDDPQRLRAICQGLYNVKAQREFKKILNPLSRETTVVHFHSWTKALSASLFSVTAKYGFRVVVTAHDYFSTCPNGTLFNFRKKRTCNLRPMSISCIYSNCDSRKYTHKLWRVVRQLIQNRTLWKNKPVWFISISRLNRELIKQYLHDRDIRLCDIGNPVELNENVPIRVQENDTYFFIGRLSAEKGIDLFCEAITSLALKAIVLGDGYMLPELKRKYPNIIFLGNIKGDRMGELLHSCRTLIFPSLCYESLGLVVLEAMSYGIPCIVPDKCAAADNVKDGATGYIFKSGNTESLKESILKINTMDISCMSKNIFRDFDHYKYSINNHIGNLIVMYSHILT